MRTYAVVLLGLLGLTGLTVWAAYWHIGWLGTPLALLIATVKATLVLLWFMHLKHSPRLTWLVALSGALWLGILLVLTLGDFLTRGWPFE